MFMLHDCAPAGVTAAPLGLQNVRYDKLMREAKQEMQNANIDVDLNGVIQVVCVLLCSKKKRCCLCSPLPLRWVSSTFRSNPCVFNLTGYLA